MYSDLSLFYFILQYYYIRSQLNGLALDVEASNPLPGAWVTTWEKTDINSQKWFDDPETGTIRSKLNSFCLDIEGKYKNIRSTMSRYVMLLLLLLSCHLYNK